MRDVVGQTLAHGYAHHIQRLMVTGQFALLAGLSPQAVADWYLAVYVDAIEWVELPNVAGMALFANGGVPQLLAPPDPGGSGRAPTFTALTRRSTLLRTSDGGTWTGMTSPCLLSPARGQLSVSSGAHLPS